MIDNKSLPWRLKTQQGIIYFQFLSAFHLIFAGPMGTIGSTVILYPRCSPNSSDSIRMGRTIRIIILEIRIYRNVIQMCNRSEPYSSKYIYDDIHIVGGLLTASDQPQPARPE